MSDLAEKLRAAVNLAAQALERDDTDIRAEIAAELRTVSGEAIEALSRPAGWVSGKAEAVAFFRWWHNQPGANTDDGYDQWLEEGRPGLEVDHAD